MIGYGWPDRVVPEMAISNAKMAGKTKRLQESF